MYSDFMQLHKKVVQQDTVVDGRYSIFLGNYGESPVANDRYLANTTPQSYSIGNFFSVSVWCRSNEQHSGGDLVHLTSLSAGLPENGFFLTRGLEGPTVILHDYDGVTFLARIFTWKNVPADSLGFLTRQVGNWLHYTITWDGVNFKAYSNGVDLGTGEEGQNDSVTHLNNNKVLYLGNSTGENDLNENFFPFPFTGNLGHVAFWSNVLTQAEVREIYKQGHNIDLTQDYRSYTSSASLEHYYRLGQGGTNLGTDLSGDADVSANMQNLSLSSIPANFPAYDPQAFRSLRINETGTIESLANLTPQDLGLANVFTISFWLRMVSLANNVPVIFYVEDSTAGYLIRIYLLEQSSSFEVILEDSLGAKDYTYTQNIVIDQWIHAVLTWNGTNLKFYFDSVENTTPSISEDDAVTLPSAATAQVLSYATHPGDADRLNGFVGPLAIWSSVLTGAEILEVFDRNFDWNLRHNYKNYISAANLKHYYRPGYGDYDLATDLVGTADLTVSAENISLEDIKSVAHLPATSFTNAAFVDIGEGNNSSVVNKDNSIVADDVRATLSFSALTGLEGILHHRGFLFTIPALSEIVGMELEIQAYRSAGSAAVQSRPSEVSVAGNPSSVFFSEENITGSPSTETRLAGTPYFQWGVYSTRDEIVAGMIATKTVFRKIPAGVVDVSVDSIRPKVYYAKNGPENNSYLERYSIFLNQPGSPPYKYLASTTPASLDIAGTALTIAMWVRPTASATGAIFDIKSVSGGTSNLTVKQNGLGISVEANNSVDSITQSWLNVLTAGQWSCLVLALDSDEGEFTLHKDTVLQTVNSVVGGIATIEEADCEIYYGANADQSLRFDGHIGPLALITGTLNTYSLAELFRNKFKMTLTDFSGNWISFSDVRHYYRPGYSNIDLGSDLEVLTFATTPVHLSANKSNITVADIVVQFPAF